MFASHLSHNDSVRITAPTVASLNRKSTTARTVRSVSSHLIQPNRRRRPRGFTLLELTVVCVVTFLIGAMLWPEMFGRRRCRGGGRQMQNTTHLVGIHKGLVLWAQGNRDRYPGIEADGSPSPAFAATATTVGSGGRNGYDPAYRLAVLMNGNYFSPEYILSPAETGQKVAAKPGQEMTTVHFSYAFLRLSGGPDTGRRKEWTATQNSRAAVGSDRNLGPGSLGPDSSPAQLKAQSLHTATGDGWRGSVVYNDNHGVYETSNLVQKTEYAGSGEITLDNLFADDNDGRGAAGNDAGMVYQDDRTYVNQR